MLSQVSIIQRNLNSIILPDAFITPAEMQIAIFKIERRVVIADNLEATVFNKEETVIMVSSEYAVFIIKHEFQGVEWC